jgi:hypothetical protein
MSSSSQALKGTLGCRLADEKVSGRQGCARTATRWRLRLPGFAEGYRRSYLQRAMDEARGSKTKAAEFVGLPSYQTLTNWLSKYESADDGIALAVAPGTRSHET